MSPRQRTSRARRAADRGPLLTALRATSRSRAATRAAPLPLDHRIDLAVCAIVALAILLVCAPALLAHPSWPWRAAMLLSPR